MADRSSRSKHDSQTTTHRDVLPIPDPPHVGLTTYDAKDPDSKFPPIEPLRPPEGAPNVLVILLDDVGFGASQRVRRAVHDADRRAAGRRRPAATPASTPPRCARRPGRRCSPAATTTRSAWAPSPRSRRPRRATARCGPNTKAPLAQTLKLNGYSTAQFGKCHEVPVWQTSPMGPFDAWPTGGGGFEHFYGFIGGETNQYGPGALRGHHADRAAEDARGGLPLRPRTWPTTPSTGCASRRR